MALTRRQFLVGAAGAGAAGLVAARHPWSGSSAGLGQTASPRPDGIGILVLLTLYGGNDGLNTVIPYTDGHYLGGRRQLGYEPNEVIPLAEGMGLHPNLKGMKQLWDRQQLAIVRGVGYPDPSRSHFHSMDVWQSGTADAAVSTGWLGRWLDGTGTDPMRAISVGASLPRAFTGDKVAASAVPVGNIKLPGGNLGASFAALSTANPGEAVLAARVAQAGSDLLRVQETVADLLASKPAQAGNNQSANPASHGAKATTAKKSQKGRNGSLSSQLQLVASLVKAQAPSRVYGVSLGGFDTHANEKDAHSRLWLEVDSAVTGFFTDLSDSPQAGRVVLATYSEFGRRVAANASGGTDHGTAAPVFVIGPNVKGGLYGDEPSLTDLDSGDLRFTTDFRSVYATLLDGVLGVDPKAVLHKAFEPVPFL